MKEVRTYGKKLTALLAAIALTVSQSAVSANGINADNDDVLSEETAEVTAVEEPTEEITDTNEANAQTEELAESEESDDLTSEEIRGAEKKDGEGELTETQSSELSAEASGTCGDNLEWEYNDGTLHISGSGDMWNFAWSGPPWYEYKNSITNVIIDDDVISIGGYAFEGYRVLKSIELPKKLESIGSGAFGNCNNLKNVYYSGTKEEWNSITMENGNESLQNARIYYNGVRPEPGKEITLSYDNGKIKLGDEYNVKNGAVLIEAEYENGRFTGMKSYNVTDNTDEIEVNGKSGNRYMLWDSKGGMYQLADSVTVD